jgi:hypothetical protein
MRARLKADDAYLRSFEKEALHSGAEETGQWLHAASATDPETGVLCSPRVWSYHQAVYVQVFQRDSTTQPLRDAREVSRFHFLINGRFPYDQGLKL